MGLAEKISQQNIQSVRWLLIAAFYKVLQWRDEKNKKVIFFQIEFMECVSTKLFGLEIKFVFITSLSYPQKFTN